jgi:hypothetical protein
VPKSLNKTATLCPLKAAAELQLRVEYRPTSSLRPDPENARKHSQRQLVRLKAVVAEFGFTNPLLIDEDNMVIAGHARLEIAQMLGMNTVPCLCLKHLSPSQKTALALADNKLGDMSEFDPERLAAQLAQLCSVEFNVELTGFETAEIDFILEMPTLTATNAADLADSVAEPEHHIPAVSRRGDCWLLGDHRHYCGDALKRGSFQTLLGERRAAMIISDVPFNVRINGHVSGLGVARHREFEMASGEMSPPEFTAFLKSATNFMVEFSTDGSMHFIFMDWRHLSRSRVPELRPTRN